MIGSALGTSEENGIGQPEADTLEARLTAAPGPLRLISASGGRSLADAALTGLPTRAASALNPSYKPLTAHAFAEYDWLVILDVASYTRGAPSLRQWTGQPKE